MLLAITVVRDYHWVRRLRIAAALSQDVRYGRILIARLPEPAAGAAAAADGTAHEGQNLSAPEEFLPCSRSIWTVDGIPAPWRRGTAVRTRTG